MAIDIEAFVKRWWYKYQVKYALIESPNERIKFLDRLLRESERVLFSSQLQVFIIEKREVARRERWEELYASKNQTIQDPSGEESVSKIDKIESKRASTLVKSETKNIDEMDLLLLEIRRKNPAYTANLIWRELRREVERKNKVYQHGLILNSFDPNQHRSSKYPHGVIFWKSKKHKKPYPLGFRSISNRLTEVRKADKK